jgi:uncharacterized membrane protein YfhO
VTFVIAFTDPFIVILISISPTLRRMKAINTVDTLWFFVVLKLSLTLRASHSDYTPALSTLLSVIKTTAYQVTFFNAPKTTIETNVSITLHTLRGKPADSDVFITPLLSTFAAHEDLAGY